MNKYKFDKNVLSILSYYPRSVDSYYSNDVGTPSQDLQ